MSAKVVIMAALGAFDLICVGTFDIIRPNKPPESGQPLTESYSIDLDAGRFCSDDCEQIARIRSISDAEIVLERDVGLERAFNRKSQTMYSRVAVVGQTKTTIARCGFAPFTGFPRMKSGIVKPHGL